jgi:hypothetical protein
MHSFLIIKDIIGQKIKKNDKKENRETKKINGRAKPAKNCGNYYHR